MYVRSLIPIGVIAVCLLCGCAKPVLYNYIDQEARIHLDAVDTYLIVFQEKIQLQNDFSGVNDPDPPTGSLISDVIALNVIASEKNRLKNPETEPETLIEPIQKSMGDYDFAKVLMEKLNPKLKEIQWLNAKDLVLLRTAEKDLFLNRCVSSNASASLFISATYRVSADLSNLTTSADLIMFPTCDALRPYKAKLDDNQNPVNEADNIYRNKLIASVPLGVEGLVQNRGEILADNGAEIVKSLLESSAELVSELIALDIVRGQ